MGWNISACRSSMTIHRIRLKTSLTEPLQATKGVVGTGNSGLYCENEDCREFMSLAVGRPPRGDKIEVVADPPGSQQLFVCPACLLRQQRFLHELVYLRLTRENRRRLPRNQVS
jgi:hypothetical protein